MASLIMDEKIRKAAIRACKEYGKKYQFKCPACGRQATAEKSVNGFVIVSCRGCRRSTGWRF